MCVHVCMQILCVLYCIYAQFHIEWLKTKQQKEKLAHNTHTLAYECLYFKYDIN